MKLKILTGVSALIAVALTLAIGAMATASADTPQNCIPTSPDDPTCLWQLELTKVEVAVEYEYPHCEVKLVVEHNLDDLPEWVTDYAHARWLGYMPPQGNVVHFSGKRPDYGRTIEGNYGLFDSYWYNAPGGGIYQKRAVGRDINYIPQINPSDLRFDHTSSGRVVSLSKKFESWQQTTLGLVYMQTGLSFDGGSDDYKAFARERRIGNEFVTKLHMLPSYRIISNAIPLSHTFAGLTEEIFTCFEVAKREHGRVKERSALDTEKAGLRQSLKLLEAELARAREHELDATNVLKEVIAISERVEEARRAIQRLRVEGIAERRKLIERYYAEESQRYSVFIKSLEASSAALAASDKAIAAHKAELEASRARLDALVTAAQEAEAELIAEIERAQESLGEDDD